MRAWIILGLVACGTARAPEVEAEAEAEAEAEPPEPEPDELPYTVVPPPSAFFFVDRCSEARGSTREEALDECRRVRRTDRWSRRWCVCEADRVFEASPEHATLSHGCCGAVAATPQLAHKECRRRLEEGWCELQDDESADEIHPVWGPYARSGPFGEFDGEHYRFVALTAPSAYGWIDETGDPPCFPDGTAVQLEDGPRNIEDVRVGDRVVAMDDSGALSSVAVTRLKTRRADVLIVLDLGTRVLRVTPRHPLLANDEWMLAGEVRTGDRLRTREGSVRVRGVGVERGPVRVHTLSVEAPHTYFAGGVLAHNY